MNLFLYIPPHSAHLPDLRKSLIFSLCQSYWLQNTRIEDYIHMVSLLRKRLIKRGHKPADIDPVFRECGCHLQRRLSNCKLDTLAKPKKSRLFFHIPFHPRDISRSKIHELYQEHCNKPDEHGNSFSMGLKNGKGLTVQIDQLTVAYSRPKNLRDVLNPTKLLPPPDTSVSALCANLRKEQVTVS